MQILNNQIHRLLGKIPATRWKGKKKSIWQHPWLHAYACSSLCYTCQKKFNNQKLSFPANGSHRFSHGHSLDVFLLWQYVFLLHSHLLESKRLTDILPASCVGMVHVTTCRVKRLANPHNTTHQGTTKTWWVSSRKAVLASCIIYYTEKSYLINTFTCLFYYLWLIDDNFHTPWIQPCFFCHVTVSRRTKVWTPASPV